MLTAASSAWNADSYADYGGLSGNSLEDLRAGHRGAIEPDKRDPADFALWKGAGEGRILKWPTPRWGEGYPGWHLECSAMAMRYLGERFDIHTGGIDNVFPHHEDEIAQSAPLVGGPPARLWVHGEFLLADGHKMAKSAGNFQRVTELVDRGLDPLALRYLALTSRYAHKLEYSDASLAGAAGGLASLRARLAGLGPPPSDGPWSAPPALEAGAAPARPLGTALGISGFGSPADGAPGYEIRDRAGHPEAPLSPAGHALHDRIVAAIDADLDMPTALAVVRETLRADLPAEERRWLVLDADAVLGLDLHRTWRDASDAHVTLDREAPEGVRRLVEARAAARAARDFGAADALRAEIESAGWEVTDRPSGPELRPRP